MTLDDFESMAAFRERGARGRRRSRGTARPQLALVDPDFAEWPLDQPAMLEGLTRFVQLPERRVVLIGRQFDSVQRQFPRFVRWRRTFAHAVQPLAPVDDGVELPTVLLADRSFALRVLERVRWRGASSPRPAPRACWPTRLTHLRNAASRFCRDDPGSLGSVVTRAIIFG